ncbi:MAG TPA: Cu(I)-responsive transcriptional regulator [Rheinheimera sp.]|jgi:Cu(I)-responsive transcriptional regulator|uniref:Cu(I)-responsive transcriptional regulator n=1 Tax=Rheinheimera sp. TaxID=1869214 RepID=UPI000EEC2321|nr:Cu(I)-responsive transcriptional regulator [Rheinheimera sp.]HCU65486.1 Cu(I)-responsive transcriptional regulator [Rheinheimera sp.]
MATLLTIGDAAKASGLSAKMIRHYEQSGLLRKSPRTDAGYRLYNSEQVNQLRFIRQARNLGFSLSDIQSLLELWQNQERESRAVQKLARQHLDEITAKIAELQHMQQVLTALADSCRGDGSPHCNILNQLAKPA